MAAKFRLALVCALVAWAGAAFAQDWQGPAKMSGKVTDEAGKSIEGVSVTLVLETAKAGPAPMATDKKGEWSIEKIANGNWILTFVKAGFDPRRFGVPVAEGKAPKIAFKMTKVGTDPSGAFMLADEKAKAFAAEKKFAEAAAAFDEFIKSYPKVPQAYPQAANYYAKAGKSSEAADIFKQFVDMNPTNVDAKLFLGLAYIDAKRYPEAWDTFTKLDPATVTDPTFYQDAGFNLLRQKQFGEAWKYFDYMVAKFPALPNAVYYRAFTLFNEVAAMTKQDTPEAKEKLAACKADLTKFLAGTTTGAEADNAKKMLEQLK